MLIETLPWLSAELAEITEESEADVDGDEYYGGRKKNRLFKCTLRGR